MSEDRRLLELQQTIYQSRNPTRRYLHQSRRRWVTDALQRLAPVSRALELGPGSGVYLATLAACAETVVALDSQAAFLVTARRRLEVQGQAHVAVGRVIFVQGDLQAPPLAAGSVDLLLCSEVIEHLPDSVAVLESLVRLLAPTGRLVLTTPQPFSPLELLGGIAYLPGIITLLRWIYREPIEATGHIGLVSPRALTRQFREAGLQVLESEVMGLYLPGIAEFGGSWGQRLLERLEGPLRASPLRWILWTQCYVLARQSSVPLSKH